MIPIQMTDIRRNGLLVPGGWTAFCLEVECPTGSGGENEAMEIYMPLLTGMGYKVDDAMELVYKIVQQTYQAGYVHKLRMSIMDKAERYAQKYPDLLSHTLDDEYVLIGFNPEVIQRYFLPIVGVGRESGVDDAMEEMANAIRQI